MIPPVVAPMMVWISCAIDPPLPTREFE
jgi:hypothetical protein